MIGLQKEMRKDDSKYTKFNPKNSAGIRLFYLRYPFKKITYPSHLPFVPKEEDTNEKFSLKYDDWRKIIQIYFKYLLLFLLSGQTYRFTSRCGGFFLGKYKPVKKGKNIDMGKTEKYYARLTGLSDKREIWKHIRSIPKEERVMFKYHNKEIDGYKWLVRWTRKEYTFAFKYHWRFQLARAQYNWLDKIIKQDRTLIYNITDLGSNGIRKTRSRF